MSPPPTILHLEWQDHRGDHERRYRKPLACARQLVAILAAPDDLVRLKGLWKTSGWKQDRIEWQPIDVAAFLEDAAAAQDLESDPDGVGLMERYRLVAQSWREHNEREGA